MTRTKSYGCVSHKSTVWQGELMRIKAVKVNVPRGSSRLWWNVIYFCEVLRYSIQLQIQSLRFVLEWHLPRILAAGTNCHCYLHSLSIPLLMSLLLFVRGRISLRSIWTSGSISTSAWWTAFVLLFHCVQWDYCPVICSHKTKLLLSFLTRLSRGLFRDSIVLIWQFGS